MRTSVRSILLGTRTAVASSIAAAFTVTLDNLVNLTGGGTTNVFMTGASGGNGVITTKVSASRLTGVAPLYVNFDATATTSTLSTNPSHELFFAHDFGDTGAGVWANGVQSSGLTSKNAGYGPVTGHVYETPGTYIYTCVSTDAANPGSRTKTIVVLDPDVVYNPAYGSGYETICFSNTGNFTGAPAGATPITVVGTDMLASFNAYKGNNKRLLFRKSDTWTCSAQLSCTSITGMMVDGFGAGGTAATIGSNTVVTVTPASLSASFFATYAGCSDLRLCNFRIESNSTTTGVGLNNSISQILISRVEVRGCTGGFNAFPGTGGTNNVFDQHCMYECVVDQLYGEQFTDTPRTTATTTSGLSLFTAVGHPFAVGRRVFYPVGGITPPTPLATNTDYYVLAAGFTANAFQLSTTSNGAAITITQTGSFVVPYKPLTGGVSAFVGLVRGGIMGCYFDSCNLGEQTVRIPFIDRGHINNNYLARPNQTKNVLKIHSFLYTEVALYSDKFVVSGNVLDLRGGYSYNGTTVTEVGDCAMTIGDGSAFATERVHNGIIENNFTYGCLSQPKNYQAFADIKCSGMTIRNNIADFSFGDRTSAYVATHPYVSVNMVRIATSTPETTTGTRVYNNTLYSNISNPEVATFVRTAGVSDDTVIKNNLWYLPNYAGSSKGVITNTGGLATNVVASNNTDNGQTATTSPNFVATPPVALTDWRPNTGSYAINTGTTVPVLRDFNNASRVGGTYDLGAILP